MTFLQFLAIVSVLWISNPENPSQLHIGLKCFPYEDKILYSHVWFTKPNQELPAWEKNCSDPIKDIPIEIPLEDTPKETPKPK